jgi:hypothetical protein
MTGLNLPVDNGSWVHKMVAGLARPARGALDVRRPAGRRLRPRPAFRRLDPWLLTRLPDEARGPRRIGQARSLVPLELRRDLAPRGREHDPAEHLTGVHLLMR